MSRKPETILLLAGLITVMILLPLLGRSSQGRLAADSVKISADQGGGMALLALRETARTCAALLWIKVDEYSHFNAPPGEYLPILRIITMLNPQFIEAYTLGAYLLCDRSLGRVSEAEAFLNEGIAANQGLPMVDQLFFEKGWIAFFHRKDFSAGTQLFASSLEQMKVIDLETIYGPVNCLRLLSWCLLLEGRHREAMTAIQGMMSIVGKDEMMSLPLFRKLITSYDQKSQDFTCQPETLPQVFAENWKPARSISPESDMTSLISLNAIRLRDILFQDQQSQATIQEKIARSLKSSTREKEALKPDQHHHQEDGKQELAALDHDHENEQNHENEHEQEHAGEHDHQAPPQDHEHCGHSHHIPWQEETLSMLILKNAMTFSLAAVLLFLARKR